jgi:predicted GTPase
MPRNLCRRGRIRFGPQFLLFVNDPRLLPETYMNFLQSRLREKWEYPGLPILLSQRGRKKRDAAS